MSSRPAWIRLTGSGMELAFITIVFGLLGSFIDRKVGVEKPIWSAAGGLIGFTLGMIRFLRLATSISKSQQEAEHEAMERTATQPAPLTRSDPETESKPADDFEDQR